MRYVVDSSVFASLIVKDEFHDIAEDFFQKNLTTELVTVDLAYVEVTNVLWKYFYIFRKIPDDAYRYLRDKLPSIIDKLVSNVYPSKNYLSKALDLSVEVGMPVYDSLFITVARESNGELATLDEELAKKLPRDTYLLSGIK